MWIIPFWSQLYHSGFSMDFLIYLVFWHSLATWSVYRNTQTYCSLWAAVTSTFGAINDAPPMKVPLWKMRQAWGHSPSWDETFGFDNVTPFCVIPFSLCSPHSILGQLGSGTIDNGNKHWNDLFTFKGQKKVKKSLKKCWINSFY